MDDTAMSKEEAAKRIIDMELGEFLKTEKAGCFVLVLGDDTCRVIIRDW
jgi:hypothetical protein